MCGIAGCLLRQGKVSRERLLLAARKLTHRGPDGEGLLCEGPLGLAHRRLAIIDLAGGKQPLTEPSQRITVVFNGEIYNYRDLRKILEAQGEVFNTHSDTEVLAVLFRREGKGGLLRLRGMFAFAAYDAKEKTLFLARDRFGKKPLFYFENQKGFFFASEIPALLALLEELPPLNREALHFYLALRYIPAPLSIFCGVKRLLPGEYLVVKEGRIVDKNFWFSLPTPPSFKLSFEEARDELRQRFDQAVRYRLVADVPVGAFLSGGIDSSLVVASMAAQQNKVYTFSVGFKDDPASELPFAQEVARRLGTVHQELILDQKSLRFLPEVIARFGEPFANETALLAYLLSKASKKTVKVVLTGDGGDEVFGGYRRYPKFLGQKWKFWHKKSAKDYFRLVSLFDYEERKVLLREASSRPERFICSLWDKAPTRDALSRMQWVDLKSYLPGDILFYTDHTTMSFGLEARAPFLDHEIVPFGLALPKNFKLKGKRGKFILRKLFPERLPENLFERKKKGFSPPLKSWLSGPLGHEIKEAIKEGPFIFKKLFDQSQVDKILKGPRTGEWAKKVFSLFVLVHFLETFKVCDAR